MNWISKWIHWFREGKWIELIDYHGKWIVGLLLAISTGLWICALGGSMPSRFLHGFYYSLQFIVLNKTADDVVNNILRYALYATQFAIPLFASITIFSKLFHDRIVPYMKKLEVGRLHNHYVIVGYGAFGQALAKQLFINGKLIVGIDLIDPPENKEKENKSNKQKPVILSYNALHPNIGKIANLEHAKCIYLLLPKERDNLSILENISGYLKNSSKVFIRTESSDMQRLLVDWVGLKALNQNTQLDIRSCNPIDIAARGIVNDYAPDIYAHTEQGPISQIVMVTGTSEAAKAILLRFARIGIFSPKGKLLVIWAGEGVTKAFLELKAIYPALDTDYSVCESWGGRSEISQDYFDSVLPTINVCLLKSSAVHAVRDGSISETCGARWPSVIYVCHDSDIRNLAEARDLQAALGVHDELIGTIPQRLILAVQSKSVVGIRNGNDIPVLKEIPYSIEEICLDSVFAKTVTDDLADDLAKGFHSVYAKRQKIDNKDWEQEKLLFKESNRDVADHLAIKARYSGINSETVANCVFKGSVNISDNDRKLMEKKYNDLVIMERRRYRAFMFMNGFTHGSHPAKYTEMQIKSGKELDRCLRVNSTLLEEKLSQTEHVKDNDIIEQSLQALQLRNNYESASTNK